MKITIINYQKAFTIGPFLQEKIGLEIEISGPETPEQALDLAKKIAEDWHQSANPHLYQEKGPEFIMPPAGMIPTISKDTEKLEIAIDNAKTVEELKALKDANPVMTVPMLRHCNHRMEELTDAEKYFTNGLE